MSFVSVLRQFPAGLPSSMTAAQKRFLQDDYPQLQNRFGLIYAQMAKEQRARDNSREEEEEVAKDLDQDGGEHIPSPSSRNSAISLSTVNKNTPEPEFEGDDEESIVETGFKQVAGDVVHTDVSNRYDHLSNHC